MKLYPAVDILDGKAVRLLEGIRGKVTVYGDPLEMAHKWAKQGAKNLHIVDLNAAFDGTYTNEDILKHIAREINITIEIGGGIRSESRARYVLDKLGFDRGIVGSSIISMPDMIERLGYIYGNKIVAGLDAKNGKISIKGWKEEYDISPLEIAKRIVDLGIEDIIYTDISRDGKMSGANIEATKKLQNECKMNVIASGGVGCIKDLINMKNEKIYGAIIGKALYENTINLAEAMKIC